MIRRGINCFVIGYSCFGIRRKSSYEIFPVDVDACGVYRDSVISLQLYAVVLVDNDDILMTEIKGIPIGKGIIPACHRKIFDTVPGQDAVLHPVVIDIQVSVMQKYAVGAVIEQVVIVKLELSHTLQKIGKKAGTQIDWGLDVYVVVTEI